MGAQYQVGVFNIFQMIISERLWYVRHENNNDFPKFVILQVIDQGTRDQEGTACQA